MFLRNMSILKPATDSFYKSTFGHDHSQPDEMPDEMVALFDFQDLVDYAACIDGYHHSGASWPQDLSDPYDDITDALFPSMIAETGHGGPQSEDLGSKSRSIDLADAVMTDGNPSEADTGRTTPAAPESPDLIPKAIEGVQGGVISPADITGHAQRGSQPPATIIIPTAGSTGPNKSAPISGYVQSAATSPRGADVEPNAASSANQTNPTEEGTMVNERTTKEPCSPDSLEKTRSVDLCRDALCAVPYINTDGDDDRNLTPICLID